MEGCKISHKHRWTGGSAPLFTAGKVGVGYRHHPRKVSVRILNVTCMQKLSRTNPSVPGTLPCDPRWGHRTLQRHPGGLQRTRSRAGQGGRGQWGCRRGQEVAGTPGSSGHSSGCCGVSWAAFGVM